MTPETRKFVEETQEVCDKAMPEPWQYFWIKECSISPHVQMANGAGHRYTIATPVHSSEATARNMQFIAASRTALPRALQVIREQAEEIQKLKGK